MIREYLHALLWAKRHLSGQLAVPELGVVTRHLQPDDVCVDVGAHAGSWMIPLSRRVSAGRVYAFEALPYYASVLNKLVTVLRRRNVTVVNRAVTERPCEVRMVWRDPAGRRLTGCTHIAGKGENTAGSVSVTGQPLDDYFAETKPPVTLLKCDVEGAELGVFRGATRLLDRCRPVIFTELTEEFCRRYGHRAADVFDFFQTREYWSFVFAGSGRPVQIQGIGEYRQNDVIFVPAERAAGFGESSPV